MRENKSRLLGEEMDTIRSEITNHVQYTQLQQIDIENLHEYAGKILVAGERVINGGLFMTMRDQVAFTNKRIIVINVQAITGKKASVASYPYAKMTRFVVQTAGLMDINSELACFFQDGSALQFDFWGNVDVLHLASAMSAYGI